MIQVCSCDTKGRGTKRQNVTRRAMQKFCEGVMILACFTAKYVVGCRESFNSRKYQQILVRKIPTARDYFSEENMDYFIIQNGHIKCHRTKPLVAGARASQTHRLCISY